MNQLISYRPIIREVRLCNVSPYMYSREPLNPLNVSPCRSVNRLTPFRTLSDDHADMRSRKSTIVVGHGLCQSSHQETTSSTVRSDCAELDIGFYLCPLRLQTRWGSAGFARKLTYLTNAQPRGS